MSPENINKLINDCIDNESLLSEWELNFIDDLDCKDRQPSTMEIEILKRIWRKATA